MRLWKKKAPGVVEPEPPRELTGIEKAELEQAKQIAAEEARVADERRAFVAARLVEIKTKIGAELQEIAVLEDELNPPFYLQQANLVNACGYGRPGHLFELMGGLGGGLFKC